MKKKIALFHLSYYFLSALVYIGFFYGISFVLNLSGEKIDLGTAMAVTYFFLFIGTPIVIAVLMRFSLFKWYVDPFAAAEIPLLLYIGMIVSNVRRTESIQRAFLSVNGKLCDDGGMGWIFLIGLFGFGLLASFSFARKDGESISYMLISRLSVKEKTSNNK